jgi:hypothetical protein
MFGFNHYFVLAKQTKTDKNKTFDKNKKNNDKKILFVVGKTNYWLQ